MHCNRACLLPPFPSEATCLETTSSIWSQMCVLSSGRQLERLSQASAVIAGTAWHLSAAPNRCPGDGCEREQEGDMGWLFAPLLLDPST